MAGARAAGDGRGCPRRGWLAAAVALAALAGLGSTSATGAELASCTETTVTAPAVADAWISAEVASNKGADTTLDVEADPFGAHTRSLVRFSLPAVPGGCVLSSAKLRLYTSSGSVGARVEVLRLASAWNESTLVWANQPAPVGAAAVAWSRDGYMQWNVLEQVRSLLELGNHGFQVRDAAEGSASPEDEGAGHGFNSRENAENAPQLVLHFGPPPTGEPPPPPAPPAPAAVRCGESITRSTLVTNDLAECPADGLVIGAARIVLDLGGHTIDGVGLGSGVLNDGFAEVTVRDGTVQDFDHGVELLSETAQNVVQGLTVRENELTAIELFDADPGNAILENTVEGNGGGIALVSGTTGVLVEDNVLTLNSGAALLVRDATGNRLEDNEVVGGGDLGVGLERATGNTLLDNEIEGTSDGGIMILDSSHANRVEDNDVSEAGDTGIMVDLSDRNELIGNTTHFMSDSGITLVSANDGVVRGNDLRFSSGGLQVDGSSRNRIEGNNASDSTGIGIELGGDSYANVVAENVALDNGATGIYVADEALIEPGNVVARNIAGRNGGDGIVLAKGGHVAQANVARANRGWGIHAAPGTVDGGGNLAGANGPGQCFGIVCSEAALPETALIGGPANPTRSTSATFSFEGLGGGGPPGFECRLDGGAFAACTSPWTYTGLGSGTHTFEVRAVSGAEGDPTPAAHTWVIDAIPPETTIGGGPAGTTASRSAVFSFSSSEPGSTFSCAIDGGAFAPCASPRAYGGLATGAHRFEVRAADAVGNEDPTPASRTWTIEADAPPPGDGPPGAGPAVVCGPARMLGAQADAWVDQRRPARNTGAGSVLRVRSGRRSNTRALVRFALPAIPRGCAVSSATLRLFAGSATRGRTLRVLRLVSGWAERGVTWRTRPRATGPAAIARSGRGYRMWNVTAHVRAMHASRSAHGFVVRDAADGARGEQRFHSRERGRAAPRLVIRYASVP